MFRWTEKKSCADLQADGQTRRRLHEPTRLRCIAFAKMPFHILHIFIFCILGVAGLVP